MCHFGDVTPSYYLRQEVTIQGYKQDLIYMEPLTSLDLEKGLYIRENSKYQNKGYSLEQSYKMTNQFN